MFGPYASAQDVLPSEGPAAARLNPARLAEVHIASLTYGDFSQLNRKSGDRFLQAAVGTPWDLLHWPVELAAGFGYMAEEMPTEESYGVYEEAEYDPAFAARIPANPESPWCLSVGLTFTINEYSVFNVARTTSPGLDAGALLSIRGATGLFGLGYAYHDWKAPRFRLPDNQGSYKVAGWMEPSFDWTSPAQLVRAQVSFYIDDPKEGGVVSASENRTGLSGWDLELKPLSWLALKEEAARLPGRSNFGLVFYLPPKWVRCDSRLEFNLGHSMYDPFALPIPFLSTFLGKGSNERIWQLGMSLSVGV